MPLGLNRGSTPSARNGNAVTLPHTFGTPITLPHNFGNPVTTPVNFGNQPPFNLGNVIVPPQVAAPTITLGSGDFQTVTITAEVRATATYYTTDDSTPTTSSTLYTTPFAITSGETVNAISVGTGLANSAVGTATFTQQATPTFSPVAGTYTSVQSVTITSAGATAIYYTTDGSTPTVASGTLYTGAISVATSETLKALAVQTGLVNSAMGSAVYTINLTTFLNSISAVTGHASIDGVNTGTVGTIDTTGATLLVAICWDSSVLPNLKDASTAVGLSGASLNTWTLATTNGVVPASNDCSCAVYFCNSPTTSTTHAFAPITSGPNYGSLQVFAFKGKATWAVDTFTITKVGSGSTVATPSIALAGVGEIIIAGVGNNAAISGAMTVNNGFNGGQGVSAGAPLPQENGSFEVAMSAYLIDNASSNISATFVNNSAQTDWATCTIALK